MKKQLLLLLTAALAITLSACGGAGSSTASDEDLKTVVGDLILAETATDTLASLLIENWTTYSNLLLYYYDQEAYEASNMYEEGSDYGTAHELRGYADEVMNEAKGLLGTEGSSDFYEAAKTYYLAVNDYLALLSEFPDGYSKLTYSNAISDCRSACQSAYSEVTFYTETE